VDELWVLAARVGQRLKERQETVTVAESSAGGLISAALLAAPGASAYFLGGTVVYTRAAREGLLSLPEAALAGTRPSTEAYAQLLARTARTRIGATWGLAETGATGPTGNRYGDAPGHACLAVSGPAEKTMTIETGRAERRDNMIAFATVALGLLFGCLDT
jgi:PncC family amidohydrolase